MTKTFQKARCGTTMCTLCVTKIDTLRDEKNALQSSALLQQQTSNIVSQIRPCPVPAYLTCNPYGCNGGLNGYGYGYPYGYGDSCCA